MPGCGNKRLIKYQLAWRVRLFPVCELDVWVVIWEERGTRVAISAKRVCINTILGIVVLDLNSCPAIHWPVSHVKLYTLRS